MPAAWGSWRCGETSPAGLGSRAGSVRSLELPHSEASPAEAGGFSRDGPDGRCFSPYSPCCSHSALPFWQEAHLDHLLVNGHGWAPGILTDMGTYVF